MFCLDSSNNVKIKVGDNCNGDIDEYNYNYIANDITSYLFLTTFTNLPDSENNKYFTDSDKFKKAFICSLIKKKEKAEADSEAESEAEAEAKSEAKALAEKLNNDILNLSKDLDFNNKGCDSEDLDIDSKILYIGNDPTIRNIVINYYFSPKEDATDTDKYIHHFLNKLNNVNITYTTGSWLKLFLKNLRTTLGLNYNEHQYSEMLNCF